MTRWHILIGVVIIIGLLVQLPDWARWLQPGVLHLLHGQPAYGATGFYNPPWIAVLLAPVAVLPTPLDRLALLALALLIYARLASGSVRPPFSSHSGLDKSNG